MFNRLPMRLREHVVSNGKVGCPSRRRDVDLDVCVACDRLEKVKRVHHFAVVRCEGSQARFDPELYGS
jgi:hypothetical protein